MGFSITWCAIREEDSRNFLERLVLTPTGEWEEFPESPASMGKLDTGWNIVWFNEYACKLLRFKELTSISVGFDILVCLVEEHVMASSSEFWSKGVRKWRISHEGEKGPKGLDVEGEPPETFSVIKGEMEKMQLSEGGDNAEVDWIFEIPLRVAQALVGFKHDEDWPLFHGRQFAVLSWPALKKGFLQ